MISNGYTTVPYILGQRDNVSYVVGGTFEEQEPERDNGYSLRTVGFGSGDRVTLVALIRLLSNTWAPAYHVVVGDVVGRKRVERMIEKLGSIVSKVDSMQTTPRGSQHHWMPRVAPPDQDPLAGLASLPGNGIGGDAEY